MASLMHMFTSMGKTETRILLQVNPFLDTSYYWRGTTIGVQFLSSQKYQLEC